MWGVLAPASNPITPTLLSLLREAGFSKLVLLTNNHHPHQSLSEESGVILQFSEAAMMDRVSIDQIQTASRDLKGAIDYLAFEGILIFGFSVSQNAMIDFFTGSHVRVRVIFQRGESISITE